MAKHVNSNWHLAPSLLCLKDWHFLVPHTSRLAPSLLCLKDWHFLVPHTSRLAPGA